MIEQPISPEDEARFMQIMAGYDEAMREHFTGPAPMCHFTPMEFHDAEAGDGSGYQCVHCGHTEDADEAWAKVAARKQRQAATN
ncbi:hypothetical protein N7388_23050 [Stutzerimonas stutzeri]|jgi:hypothetical protein|uniref:Uncharacterized protein n=1 Tax=Stutzerimonas stutzeri TaxID=316 RepID=A0A023WYM7_STUST|nr:MULTISPECIES: hypothetical protein [Pseudomonadaceae]QCT95383.1 hypothetical protein FEV13_00060 [Stutzerimonas degradans]AHY45183.1 hypothetical protein UIB01_22545 [Stutzerimonas decontaminans]MBA1265082.1 hypothetical protein [Stutzerimonas stutzeri]MBA1306093.1 hypothetical protein [Stutzerimonas stutzeri]MBH8796911.1 hypothetical protein [Pseudomonas aeruginosa]